MNLNTYFSGAYWFKGGTGAVCRTALYSRTSPDHIYKRHPSGLVHYSWDFVFSSYGKTHSHHYSINVSINCQNIIKKKKKELD